MAVPDGHMPRLVEQYIDDDPLRRREHHLIHEGFLLDSAAVTTDQLHPGLVEADIEDPRVGGVGEVEAHHLSDVGRTGQRRRHRR